MNNKVTKEIKQLVKKLDFDCSVEEFKNTIDNAEYWNNISCSQTLSEDFIREFKNEVNWCYILTYQTLSEDFIREFKNKVDWDYISKYQTVSKFGEDFIREFKNKINWDYISSSQNLSNFSKKFMKEFKSEINIKIQKSTCKKKTLIQKKNEVKIYAKKYNLKYDKEYLYAFRNHDENGCGLFNKTIKYKKGKYYKDWRCDMRENADNSFGLGIWPKGNTKVKIKISDWGVAVNKQDETTINKTDGKARVMGFEII